jgi:hypothetical protein
VDNKVVELHAPRIGYHVWDFCEEELKTRGWSKDYLAHRMSGDYGVNRLMLDLIEHARDAQRSDVVFRGSTADLLAEAFGVSAELFVNLDAQWKASQSKRCTCPGWCFFNSGHHANCKCAAERHFMHECREGGRE